jgi:hypothetical protein
MGYKKYENLLEDIAEIMALEAEPDLHKYYEAYDPYGEIY